MDEEDWMNETDKSMKGYELDDEDYGYDEVLKEEKLAKFREDLEEEIIAKAKVDAKEAEHKLHHTQVEDSRYRSPKAGLVQKHHSKHHKIHPDRKNAWNDEQMGNTHSAEYEAETTTQLKTPREDNYQFKVEKNWNQYPMGSFENTRSH
jgi:hypothetical protein